MSCIESNNIIWGKEMKKDYVEGFIKKIGFENKDSKYEIIIDDYKIDITFNDDQGGNIIDSNINYGDKIIVEHGGITNLTKKESLVQLECVIRLLQKGYKPESIELEKTYRLGHKDKGRLDVLIKKEGVAWCLIECKTYGEQYNNEIEKVKNEGGQIFSYYAQDRTPMIIGVYSSDFIDNNIVYEFYQISTKKLDKVGSVNDIFKSWNKEYIENGIFANGITAYEDENFNLRKRDLKDLNKEIGNKLYNSFMEILRRHAISDKSNAFNIFFNLFVCKIYDEELKKDSDILDFQWKTQDSVDSLLSRISKLYYSAIKQYLSLECDEFFYTRFSDNMIFPVREFSFVEILNKNDYVKNANILIEVVKILQEYKIKYFSRQQFLGDFFENLLNKGFKQESGQFFTPIPLTRFILKSLPIDKIIQNKISNKEQNILPYVIDYACGSGHFLTESMLEIERNFKHIKESDLTGPQLRGYLSSKDNYYWAKEYIYGIEKDSRLAKTAKIAMFLNGDGDADIVSYDGLADFYENNVYKNKLRSNVECRSLSNFDLVVSNPPFSVEGFFNTMTNIDNFVLKNCLTEKSSEIECFFFERTLQLLKDGGYAGLIFPLSILNNTSPIYTYTRQLLIMNFDILNLTEFREKVFSATNTSVVVLFLRKRSVKELLEIVNLYCEKKQYKENKKIELLRKSINENKYLDESLSGKLTDFILELKSQEDVLVAFSGEKKTQEYFQGYRIAKARGREELVENNYGILNSLDGDNTGLDLASIIHSKMIGQIKDFSNSEVVKYAKEVKNGEIFSNKENKYVMEAPSKFLTQNIIKVESISPYGDVIDNYELSETSLSELQENGELELISGLNYSKDAEVPYETKTTVLTASNIDIKTGRLTYDTKLIYLKEDFEVNNLLQVKKNDIIISMSSGSLKHLGKVALVDSDKKDMIGGFLHIIRCKDKRLSFAIYNRLMSKSFREYVFSKKGQNINNLNMKDLAKLKIAIPTDLDYFFNSENKVEI